MLNSMLSSTARLSARPDTNRAAAATAHAAHAASPAGCNGYTNSDPYVHHRLQVIKLNISEGSRDGFLYVPPTYAVEAGPSPLLVMLHGAGGHGKNTLATFGGMSVFDKNRCLLLGPESRSTTWDMIRGDFGPDVDYINQTLEYVFSRYNIDSNRLGIAGFSDGASYALSLGLPNGGLFSHIIAFSPGFMKPPSVAGSPRIYICHGVRDQVPPVDDCSRHLVPCLQKLQPRGEMHYVEFDGPHIMKSDIAQDSLAVMRSWRLWQLRDTTSGHLRTRLLPWAAKVGGLQQVLDTANLEKVVSGAAGILAGTSLAAPVARAAVQGYSQINESSNDRHAQSNVSLYSDLIMTIAAAVATMQLPLAEPAPKALAAKLLVAVGHVWSSTPLGVFQAETTQGPSSADDKDWSEITNGGPLREERVPLLEAYARTTVALRDFLSHQGFCLGTILRSLADDAGAVKQVAAAPDKAKVLAKGLSLRRVGSVSTSQGVTAVSVMHTRVLPETTPLQQDLLSDVLEEGVEHLQLDL